MRKLLLIAVYFLLVTPIGLLSRVVYDPLARRWERRSQSYWIPTAGRNR